jgi:SAM-dependent methyltransferase
MATLTHGDWGAPDVVANYRTTGYTDPGERAALTSCSARAHGHVLDVGVGGGRTTGMLHGNAQSYVGIDVAAGMVELARSRYPEVDLRVMDACDLSRLASGSFDLVVFSFNGIDSLDHERRATAARELARVLAPDGRLVLSSLTLDGISHGERPWTVHLTRPRLVIYRTLQLLLHPVRWVRSVQNYRRTRHLAVHGDDWAMTPMRAHEYRFVVHFATIGATVRLLRDAGLVVEAAWDDRGRPVDPGVERAPVHYVHYVCRHA